MGFFSPLKSLFDNKKVKSIANIVNFISKHSFNIFLMHLVIMKVILYFMRKNFSNIIFIYCLTFLLTFIINFIISILLFQLKKIIKLKLLFNIDRNENDNNE